MSFTKTQALVIRAAVRALQRLNAYDRSHTAVRTKELADEIFRHPGQKLPTINKVEDLYYLLGAIAKLPGISNDGGSLDDKMPQRSFGPTTYVWCFFVGGEPNHRAWNNWEWICPSEPEVYLGDGEFTEDDAI